MNLTFEMSMPMLTVFMQGLLSFFSPCVLPLIPVYMSYLAGGMQVTDEYGNISYPRKKVFVNTFCFVAGVSFAFFLLGFGFSAIGRFFKDSSLLFARIGALIMIFFGLYQLGVFGKAAVLEQERRLPFRLDKWAVNPFAALLLGFCFSFAWTPCIGPALTGVLLMASSSSSAAKGFLLIGVYVLGFVLPFLLVGIFTSTVLRLFRKYRGVIRYTVKIGGVLLILMGIMTLTGWMNGFTSYLSSFGAKEWETETSRQAESGAEEVIPIEESPAAEGNTGNGEEYPVIAAPDFTLTDQFGETHTLSDYQGKTVFLNFWATWCGPCRQEMPDIQSLYEKYGENKEDLIILGISNPVSEDYPNSSDVSQEEIVQFLEDNGYSYPVVMDYSGDMFRQYGISAFPTTFMIDKEGNVFGYVTGGLTLEMMESIIEQTMTGERK